MGVALISTLFVERIGWMLVHSTWQFTIVALLVVFVSWLLRKQTANIRYVAFVLSFSLLTVIPMISFLLVDVSRPVEEEPGELIANALHSSNLENVRSNFSSDSVPSNTQAEPLDSLPQSEGVFDLGDELNQSEQHELDAVALPPASNRESESTLLIRDFRLIIQPGLPFVVLFWLAGVVLFTVRPMIGMRTQQKLKRVGVSAVPKSVEFLLESLAQELGVRQTIRIAESVHVRVPLVVGYLRPLILIPAYVLTGLSSTQLQALLAHELAHIRRNDWLVNAIQVLVETLFFYHPAVWWLSKRIRQEREYCCDDIAMSVINDRPAYTQMLLALEENRQRIPTTVLAASGGALLPRVRRLLAKEDRDATWGWLTGIVLLALISVGSAIWAASDMRVNESATTVAQAEPKEESDEAKDVVASPVTELPRDMKNLINRVRENEALFRNLDATIKMQTVYKIEKKKRNTGGFSFGPSLLKSSEKSHRMVTQGDLFFFSGESVTGLTTGKRVTEKQTVVFDGTDTVAITKGNSATLFHGRHEPALMSPPHCWGMMTLGVNFPLSVYLEGTAALKSHSKVQRHPTETGATYEFNKVESEFVGTEKVDDLDCVKVKVRRWYSIKRPPVIQYLWLARDRNYHVVQVQTARLRKEKEIPGEGSRVTKWQQLAKGIWLPVSVEPQYPSSTTEPVKAFRSTRSFSIEQTSLNPKLSSDFFKLPKVPASLIKFVISDNSQLVESPQHPTPINGDADTTLDSIIEQLAKEEAKYDFLELNTTERYEQLNPSSSASGGIYINTEARERSILAGNQLYYEQEKNIELANGDKNLMVQRQAYDGQQSRKIYEYRFGDDQSERQRNITLELGGPEQIQVQRAHTMVFRGDRNRQSVSQFLKTGWFDLRNKYKYIVKYVGAERIGNLHCYKLKCTTNVRENDKRSSYFYIWLARDRNLIPIRMEWHQPKWNGTLPTGIKYVDDLREIRPGIWFPYHTTHLAFQKISPRGLSANQLLLQWRNEIQVDSLKWNPEVDDQLFNQVEVSAGTNISVRDEQGNFLGRFKQANAGNVKISPEELLQLRQKAKVRKDEAERRERALKALINQPAPELPSTTWLDSEPLTWKKLKGKVVIIDFWANWCPPCNSDLERLEQLHKVWQKNDVTNRVLLGIHTAASDHDKVTKVVTDKKLDYPIIIDSPPKAGRAAWGALFDAFAVQQIPITIVVDQDGKVAAFGRLEEMLSKAAQLANKKQSE